MPVLAAVFRNRLGSLLIVLQVCLTLAIVANAAVVVGQQLERMSVPSGVDEANVFTLLNRWVGQPQDFGARAAGDVALLRGMPGVLDAISTNGVPLSGRGWGSSIDRKPFDPAHPEGRPRTYLYYVDDHGANALGVELRAGRWFTAEEVDSVGSASSVPVTILTETLARQLFPHGDALGGQVYFYAPTPTTVIGIVRQLAGADAVIIGAGSPDAVALLPQHFAQPVINNYIVRTRPGALQSVMRGAPDRLRAADPMRVVWEVRSFQETRANAFRRARALSVVLLTVSALLLVVTAFGIVGLITYWVSQRRRSIGVHRALGARRSDIVLQVQLESLAMSGFGVVLGVAVTLLLNLWLSTHLGVPRLTPLAVAAGALALLALAQFAALWPALRAAAVPPALATRSG